MPEPRTCYLRARGLSKTFTLHAQGGVVLPVLNDVNLDLGCGECVALAGPSGSGKSTLMRALYGNYRIQAGGIDIHHDGRWLDLAQAAPRDIMAIRRQTLGYVSQFLRVIPRVPAIDVVAAPLRPLGIGRTTALERAAGLLARLNVPERLWSLPPATFSGGEQQRINIARGFIHAYPILFLDEPTASLDPANRDTVVSMIQEATRRGAAILGIFHDVDVRERVATRVFSLRRPELAA